MAMERSKDWMDEAEGDLEHARSDMDRGYYNWACFSAQQSAEKAVKAVFQRMGAEAWGHSVADLLNELAKKYDVPEGGPNAHPSGSARRRYTKEEARRLIEHAEKIFRFCSNLLSKI
jgi:HEPN domain-containing protein